MSKGRKIEEKSKNESGHVGTVMTLYAHALAPIFVVLRVAPDFMFSVIISTLNTFFCYDSPTFVLNFVGCHYMWHKPYSVAPPHTDPTTR